MNSSDVVSKTIEAKKQEVMRLVAQNGENIAGGGENLGECASCANPCGCGGKFICAGQFTREFIDSGELIYTAILAELAAEFRQ